MERQIEKLRAEFGKRFSSTPRFFQAPGRVNVIGEHTDYNDGFVMPFAIDRQTIAAIAPRNDSIINAVAFDLDEAAIIDLKDLAIRRRGNWIDYIEGTVRCVAERFGEIRGADLLFSSSVPIGSGLSSSAAIEIAVGLAVVSVNGIELDKKELAFAAQQAEHQYAGVRSGIMDQFASVFSLAEHATLLDCRSLDIDHIPITSKSSAFVVIDSKVKHSLASSEYNRRREECESAVELLSKSIPGLSSLRDVTVEQLVEFGGSLPNNLLRRARHVIHENARTLEAARAFREKDLAVAGRLMFESHRSLRDDYEVSCGELDVLVEIASATAGVYGARMTGGGFGGCTVNLVRKDVVSDLKAVAIEKYSQRFGFAPEFYTFQATNGASEVIF